MRSILAVQAPASLTTPLSFLQTLTVLLQAACSDTLAPQLLIEFAHSSSLGSIVASPAVALGGAGDSLPEALTVVDGTAGLDTVTGDSLATGLSVEQVVDISPPYLSGDLHIASRLAFLRWYIFWGLNGLVI